MAAPLPPPQPIPWFSPSQFQDIYIRTVANRGDSVNVRGDQPDSGHMVSLHGAERVVPESAFGTSSVAGYALSQSDELQRPARYLGHWIDDDDEAVDKPVYQDVSIREPDRVAAIIKAHQQDQLAVYDVGTGETIPVISHEAREARRRRRGYEGPLRYRDAL